MRGGCNDPRDRRGGDGAASNCRRPLAVHSLLAAGSGSAARAAAGPAEDRIRLLAELNAEPQLRLNPLNSLIITLRNQRIPPRPAYHRLSLE